jgi:hypothetical protein
MECGGNAALFPKCYFAEKNFIRSGIIRYPFGVVITEVHEGGLPLVVKRCSWGELSKRLLHALGVNALNVKPAVWVPRGVSLNAGGFVHEAFIQGIEVSRLVYGEGVPTMLVQQLLVPRVHINDPAEFPFCARFVRDALPVTTAVIYEARVARTNQCDYVALYDDILLCDFITCLIFYIKFFSQSEDDFRF